MFVAEPERETPLFAEHEVVVLGGGPAGIAAAAAAGRAGRSTMLVERYGFLGGAGTAAGLANFCGLHAKVHGEHRQVVHGIADDVLQRLKAMDALSAPHSLTTPSESTSAPILGRRLVQPSPSSSTQLLIWPGANGNGSRTQCTPAATG